MTLIKANPQPCPSCGKMLNALGRTEKDQEVLEDMKEEGKMLVSLCMYCQELLIFDHETIRLPTDQERKDITANKELTMSLQDALKLITHINSQRN